MIGARQKTDLMLSVTLIVGFLMTSIAYANKITESDIESARDSSAYWRQHLVKPGENEDVLTAHQVYDRLLITWDLGRVPPKLMVVDNATGPWAASLTDGTILLSQAALELSLRENTYNAEDRLAFVLAHELAHQRNQDWWHRRFFSTDIEGAPSLSMEADPLTQNRPNEDEWQADLEGLVMMTLAGYNPAAVVGDNNFFDTWIESVWGTHCHTPNIKLAQAHACNEAQTRTQHLKTRLKQLADATLLFELGTQAYVMGEFRSALSYFTEFGRLFPSRAVHTNIGLSFLGEAQNIQTKLNELNDTPTMTPLLPLELGTVELSSTNTQAEKDRVRGIALDDSRRAAERKRLTLQLKKTTQSAIKAFDHALQLAPDHPTGYVHLACAYLVNGNTPMARGVIEGQYQRHFGQDQTSTLMRSLISMYENDRDEAHQGLSQITQTQDKSTGPLNEQLLHYTATYNLALLTALEGNKNKSVSYWQQLAERSQQNGNVIMFRMALANENRLPLNLFAKSSNEKVSNIRRQFSETEAARVYNQTIQFDNKHLAGHQYSDGRYVVLDDRARIIAAWVYDAPSQSKLITEISYENPDRILNQFGIPSRMVLTERGTYWAYDGNGIAFLVTNDKVNGWFFYPNKQLPAPPVPSMIVTSRHNKG